MYIAIFKQNKQINILEDSIQQVYFHLCKQTIKSHKNVSKMKTGRHDSHDLKDFRKNKLFSIYIHQSVIFFINNKAKIMI